MAWVKNQLIEGGDPAAEGDLDFGRGFDPAACAAAVYESGYICGGCGYGSRCGVFRLFAESRVDLIASGYDWICPCCDESNQIVAIPRVDPGTGESWVSCGDCGRRFKINPDYCHAWD